MIPTFVNKELETIFAPPKHKKIAINGWLNISKKLNSLSKAKYNSKYRFLYKFEILNHNISTIAYILNHKGFVFFFKLIFKRLDEVKMMFRWIVYDRSKITKDDDAILENRKKQTSKELFSENRKN
jgi:hypothetical protein